MPQRFVVISDIHAHPWAAFSKGDGLANSRLAQTLRVLDASLAYAQRENIPWLFGGDLVHTAGYALNVVLTGATAILRQYPDVEKVTVWGNHDARGVGGLITLEQTIFGSLLAAIPKLSLLDTSQGHKGIIHLANGLTVAGAGYQPRAELLTFGPKADIGLYHQTVRGSRTAMNFMLEEGIDPQELYERYTLSIVGHVHHPQQIEAPGHRGILIPGSPEHHNFSDEGEHGWWVVTMPPDDVEEHSDDCAIDLGIGCDCPASLILASPQLEFIAGGSPEFRTVDTPADIQKDGNFYRVRTIPAGSSLPADAVAIGPTPTTVEARDVLRGVSDVEQILQVWLKTRPPEEGVDAAAYLGAGRELLIAQEPTRLRNTRLTEIHLKDFCCYQNQELVIRPGLWLITGQGKDYPSNGAGKSTLVGEALYWLLFGRTTKGLSADDVIRHGAIACEVRATFADADGEYLDVRRHRGEDGHSLTIHDSRGPWAAPSVNAMTAKLGKYLGLTPEIFQNLAYFSQEKLLLFSSATDGERKTVLADLIGLSAYQSASAAANAQVSAHEREHLQWNTRLTLLLNESLPALTADAQQTILRLRQWEEQHTASILRAEQAVQLASDTRRVVKARGVCRRVRELADARTRVYKQQLAHRRAHLEPGVRATLERDLGDEREELNRKIRREKQALSLMFVHLTDAQEHVTLLPQYGVEQEQLEKEFAQAHEANIATAAAYGNANAQLTMLRAAQVKIEAEVTQAEATLASGVCPTCQQSVTPKHRALCLKPLHGRQADNTNQLQGKIDELADLRGKNEAAHKQRLHLEGKVQALRTLLPKVYAAEQHLNTIAALELAIGTLGAGALYTQLIEEKVDRQVQAEQVGFTNRLQRRVTQVETRVDQIEVHYAQQLAQAEAVLRRLTTEQNPHTAALNQAANRVVVVKKQIEEATTNSALHAGLMTLYDYWCVGFSKQGLQSLLVEEIAILFNANRSAIFPLLTQGVYDVQFSTLSKTRGDDLREKTEFLVFEHGEPVLYEALSGGQRRRIDIGIMLVLVDAVAQWMGTAGVLGLLILDEVFGFLDASGAEGLVAALNQINERIPTIFTITHDSHLQSLVPHAILVTQGADGVSRVQ